ncbi:hypothetical protein WICPIJ_008348, partial [Wickerhamomyces pijperi]
NIKYDSNLKEVKINTYGWLTDGGKFEAWKPNCGPRAFYNSLDLQIHCDYYCGPFSYIGLRLVVSPLEGWPGLEEYLSENYGSWRDRLRLIWGSKK